MSEEIRNITDDYSCGNCGWSGNNFECVMEFENENKPDGDAIPLCPKCYSEQVGEVTIKDFKPGNALHGCLWHGKIVTK